jgi:hypothetical protein
MEANAQKPTKEAYLLLTIILVASDLLTSSMIDSGRKAYKELRKMDYDLENFDLQPNRMEKITEMLKEKKLPPWCDANPSRTQETDRIYADLWKEARNQKAALATAYGETDRSDPYHMAKWMSVMMVACNASYDECRTQRILAARSAYAKFLEAGETLEDYYDEQVVADMLQTLLPYTRK